MVGARLKSRRHQLLIYQRVRLVVSAPAAFIAHYFHFLFEFGLRQDQIMHAVGFQLERQRELGFFQGLEIGGLIVIGKCVLAPARRRDLFGELARRHLLRTLEHHVLQHMRHPRGAVVLIHTAGLVPHLGNDHRGAMVFFYDHFEPVG